MCEALVALSEQGVSCKYVGHVIPYHLQDVDETIVSRCGPVPTRSDAIGCGRAVPDAGVLLPFELAEELVRAAASSVSNSTDLILWAHYLYPYGFSALLASRALRSKGVRVQTWVTPAGSDIWEIGPQVGAVTAALLADRDISRIVTYSKSFAQEIRNRYGLKKPVDVVTPSVSPRFRVFSSLDRAAIRRRLGFPEDGYIVSHHSNMRPVKAPGDVVDVVRRFSCLTPRQRTILVLSGPTQDHESYVSDTDIYELAVVRHVEDVLCIADVEINLSLHDSFNLSLAEAMASGLPVLSTDVVGIGASIQEANAGFLFPVEQAEVTNPRARYAEAVDALVRLERSPRVARALGLNGAAYARANFAPKRAADAYMRIATECSEAF
jgi:glycosyltransferase involved in cell wall biosynthesis